MIKLQQENSSSTREANPFKNRIIVEGEKGGIGKSFHPIYFNYLNIKFGLRNWKKTRKTFETNQSNNNTYQSFSYHRWRKQTLCNYVWGDAQTKEQNNPIMRLVNIS